MSAAIYFLAAATSVTHFQPAKCYRVDLQRLRTGISAILSSTADSDRATGFANLGQDWNNYCEKYKISASRQVVEAITPLLIRHETRMFGTFLLKDIGTNLRFAKKPLYDALREQTIREKDQEAEAAESGFGPATGHIGSLSLRCVIWKLQRHTHNKMLCRYLDRMTDRP